MVKAMITPKRKLLTIDEAETIGLQTLAFLAEEPERLGRFLSLTGIGPDNVRAAATDRAFLAAVIGHLREDESLLLVFAATAGLPAEQLGQAESMLKGEQRAD